MPVISVFYGIKVMMYWFDTDYHHKPHVHVQYSGYEASVEIESGELLGGQIPARQLKLVRYWLMLHREECMDNWNRAISGTPVYKIEPLQ